MKQLILILLICLILFGGCVKETDFANENQNIKSNNTEPEEKIMIKTKIDPEKASTDPKEVELTYVLRGKRWELNTTFYGGINDYLQKQPRTISYKAGEEVTDLDFIKMFLDESNQKTYLETLVDFIKQKDVSDDDKVRIAASLVQNIPYDYELLNDPNHVEKYPYQVLYLNKGICGEKSKLLIYFLRELGYGTAYLSFEQENHATAGIKCPTEYSYKNSGYCFIESTSPTIITYSEGKYISVGKLLSEPKIIEVNEGKSFDSVIEKFNDTLKYKELLKDHSGDKYSEWLALMSKYGLEQSSCSEGFVLCNGDCWTNCSANQISICDSTGAICKWDPNNCPTEMISCNNECYTNCEQGTFKCTKEGAVCQI